MNIDFFSAPTGTRPLNPVLKIPVTSELLLFTIFLFFLSQSTNLWGRYETSSGHHWSVLPSGEGEMKFDNNPGSLEWISTSTAFLLLLASLCALRSLPATNRSLQTTHWLANSEAPPFTLPPMNPRMDPNIRPDRRYATQPAVAVVRVAITLGSGYPVHGDPDINTFCERLFLRSSVSIHVDNPCQH